MLYYLRIGINCSELQLITSRTTTAGQLMLVRRRRYIPAPVLAALVSPRSIIRKLWRCQLSSSQCGVNTGARSGLVTTNNNNNKQQQTTTPILCHPLVNKESYSPLESLWSAGQSSTSARILQQHQLYTASLLTFRSDSNNVADCIGHLGFVSYWQLWCQCHSATQHSQSVLTGYFIAEGSHHHKITFSSPTFWSRLRDSTKPTLTTMWPCSPPQMMQWTHFPGLKMRTLYFIIWVGTDWSNYDT